jgi:trehalose 6-phosphate phosphatase
VRDGAAAIARLSTLDPAAIALLLDFDGTLVEIAPIPDAVEVPQALRAALARLIDKTSGALAIVSGREIAALDRLLGSHDIPIVGGHGAEMRVRDNETVRLAAPLPAAMREALVAARAYDPGIVVEGKGYSVTLHYLNAPQQEARLRRHIDVVLADYPAEAVEVQPGKAVFEIKRQGVSKGTALRRLMTLPPFKGRRPVFIGDDETDKTLFALLPEFDGLGFSVALDVDGLAGIFASPAEVRGALQALAGR